MVATRSSIVSLQQELIYDFQALQAHPQMALDYLIQLGKKLPDLPLMQRIDKNLVSGCLARVWLTHTEREGYIYFEGDSEAMITKGLLALLIHVFSGQRAEDILTDDLSFISSMQLPHLLGNQRRAGLGNMITQIRQYARLYTQSN